jgi:predicted enzyme related to lactoylglutathione lyase
MVAAVIYVKDLRPMQAFYEQCFAMSTVDSDGDEFCILESDHWELSLVSIPAAIAATFTIADPPVRRADTPVKLAFAVQSIENLLTVIARTGGRTDPIESAWEFRNHRHLDCLDPEGNVLPLRQRVPE